MKLLSFLVTLLFATQAYADITIRWGNSHLRIQQNQAQNRQVVPAPQTINTNATDQQMAIQTLALALTETSTVQKYVWYNRASRNGGEVIIYGQIDGVPEGCVGLSNILSSNGYQPQSNYMVACQGGGNSNTWIVDNRWVISSVNRTSPDHQGCVVRFVDPKIPGKPRAASTLRACFDRSTSTWTVG